MKKITSSLLLISFVLLQSCQSNDSENKNTSSKSESKVILNSNTKELATRINFSNAGVIRLTTSNTTSKNSETKSADNFPMSLLAEVNPPVYEGKVLTASHIDVKDKYIYVAYNTQGETYLGGIDVIDVSEPNNPKLVIQAILPNTDISTVVYKNGVLYIAGAMDKDSNPTFSTSAFVAKMPLENGLLTNNYSPISLIGNVATGLANSDNNFFAISGNNGKLVKFKEESNEILASIPIADLRAVGRLENKVVIYSGTEGIKIYNADSMTLVSSISTTIDVPDAKRTIDFQENNLIVAEGYSGLKVYNSEGSLQQNFPLPAGIANVDQEDVVTNAVSVNGDYVYSANGAAGVAVYKKSNNALTPIGSIFIGGSANYVKSVGEYIFVASGTGGLKIIKKLNTTSSSLDCTSFPKYTGGEWLNVNSGENLKFQGPASLQGLNVNQNLTFCGSLSVSQGLNINSNGIFTIKGDLAQGQASNPWASFNINGTLKVDGNIIIYGDLILNSGARLEFSSGSTITIYGSVTKNSGVTITGDFTDTNGKLK